jgi:hypothetical protein
MSDIWYYAEGNQSVGPKSLSDMTAILSHASNARNILVWRDGFASWVRAENVPELAPHVIKPPPLPASPPPLSKAITVPSAQPVFGELRANDQRSAANKRDLVGISGWLVLVAIGQVLGPLYRIFWLLDYYGSLDRDLWINFPITAYGEAALNMSVLAILIYTSYLFFTKSRLFPTFFVYASVAAILLYPLDVGFTAATLRAYSGQSTDQFTPNMMTPDQVGRWVGLIITACIWIPYVKLSKRVANTFVN